MESCPFCRIREGALSAHVLYEDDEVLAFLDIYPVTQGHTLVVPRRGVNDGRAAGQEVPHVHVHVIPRYGGEGGGVQRIVRTRGPVPPLAETAARILAALKT
ncbi:MAG: HIT family protein [candidate division NC10 bacterium]|nr:HIT family protein [candidate division NC10 bacterium]